MLFITRLSLLSALALVATRVEASARPSNDDMLAFINANEICSRGGDAYEIYAVSADENRKSVWYFLRIGSNTYTGEDFQLVLIEGNRWLGICGGPQGRAFTIFE